MVKMVVELAISMLLVSVLWSLSSRMPLSVRRVSARSGS